MVEQTLLRVAGATFGYRGVPIVRNVELAVRPGEVLAVLGANGAGKTTLVRGICGRAQLLSGEVLFRDRPCDRDLSRMARGGLALIPEERAVIRALTVEQNLRLARGRPQVAYTMFPELDRIRGRRGGLLSGGEQQMLGIGAALSRRPRLIIVDELSTGLAPIVTTRLLDALRQAADEGIGVLVVEQRIDLVARIADRCVVLAVGAEVMSCSGDEMAERFDELAAHYLGTPPAQSPPPQRPHHPPEVRT